MIEVVWEDPPAPARGPGRYREVVAELKKKPGKWAVVEVAEGRKAHSHSASLRRNRGVESTVRKQTDGTFKVYARYVGDADG